jgi:hypothetical protein
MDDGVRVMSKTAERTHPELWETVKAEVKESERGGKAGEWSARKAQLAVQEYKKRGGGSRGGKSPDASVKQWPAEEWSTKTGQSSDAAGERYLPRQAHESLGDEEYRATRKTGTESREDKPFSRQSPAIPAAPAQYRDTANAEAKPEPTKTDLLRQAKMLEIDGRSRMNKEELVKAIRYAKH